MLRHPGVRIALALTLVALGLLACAHSGTPRICYSVGGLLVTALLARTLPDDGRLPHPAIRGVLGVIGGVAIISAAFGIYLVFVLTKAPAPVLVGIVLLLAVVVAFLTRGQRGPRSAP